MIETKNNKENVEETSMHSTLLEAIDQIDKNCDKAKVILKGFEVKQINDEHFTLTQQFISEKSSLTKTSIMNILEDYESIRQKVREITEISFVDFEILYPNITINFETYYSIAINLVNLINQMQLMKFNCYRLLKA
ncbi:MAG: hypothetical protein AC479_08010 [miscellaneous Crenarchaeota group-6 archaeon AD8-1]|nr:MAG: hypothetical protein AC479_08010 [miscellaneous Crenarchaeota group-6 archaeon AD8-1]